MAAGTRFEGARAKIDWADEQIGGLQSDIAAFAQQGTNEIPPYPGFTKGKRFRVAGPIPQRIRIKVGMIIQAQRDSLDYLVYELAMERGVTEESGTAFPIGKSEATHADKAARRKVAALSPEHQAIVFGLKPYRGGNALLYALHWLSNHSKHRKMIALVVDGGGYQTTGNGCGYLRRVVLWEPPKSPEPDAAILMIDADPDIDFNLTLAVAFREVPDHGSKPVIEMLREFSRLADSIIDLFE